MTKEQAIILKIHELNLLLVGEAKKEYSQVLQDAILLLKEQQEEISKYKTLYERALSDVVKTDKQIDLMADEIIMTKPINCTKTNEFSTKKIYMSKEEIKQYFERKVEDEEK